MGEAVLRRLARVLPFAALLLGLPLLAQGQAPVVPVPVQDPAGEDSGAPPPGPLVTAIEIRSETPVLSEEPLSSLLDVQAGEPLTNARVRRTLRNLHASGFATEIELYTRETPEEPGGVVVVIVLRPAVRVEAVRIEGELGLSETELRGAVPQAEGETLSEERVLRGVYDLQDLYRERGYFQAAVHVQVETDEARQQATVLYQVESGPRTLVSEIAFEGTIAPLEAAALKEPLRLKEGQPYRQRAVEGDVERLQQWLIRQHHAAARVEPAREEYDPATNRVRLIYPIDVGPSIVIDVVGADAKRLRRRGLLPFLGETGYDEALVLQSVARLKRYYQEQGHYHVQIESKEQQEEGFLRLTLTIVPGPQYTLQEIDFEGNTALSDEDLAKLMATSKRALLRLGSGRLVQEELDTDVDNIRSSYALQGYSQAEVGPARITEKGTELRVTIPIVEGPRQKVGRLELLGFQELKEEDLRRQLRLRADGPFHPVLLDESLRSLREYYVAQGFAQVQVSAVQEWNPGHDQVSLTFKILEGPRQVVDHVIVRGNRRTESQVVRRSLGLRPGEPVSQSRLLEAQSNLYRLGIFSSVEVALTRAGLGDQERNVLVRVEEGRPRRLTYGIGYDTEDGARGLLGYSHNNVFGRAYSLRTDLRLSQRDRLFRAIFDQPYLGQYPVSLTSLAFWEHEEERGKPYNVNRYGARVEAARVFGSRRVSLGLDYRTVETALEPGFALNDVEREDRPYQLSSLVPSFFWDRRDNPLDPTRGWSSQLQLQYAFPAFVTDAEFLKLFGQQTQFLKLGRTGVVAASLRFGGIEPFSELGGGDPDLPDDLPSSDVFIDERFFAGGRNTHRGYNRDFLGIRGQTLIQRAGRTDLVPVGGNGLFLFNLEYRFPVAGPVGGTLFYDTGNVWADWRDIRVDDFKEGVGAGVRYLSPIGPLRFEVGWPLDLELGEERKPVYFFSVGSSF